MRWFLCHIHILLSWEGYGNFVSNSLCSDSFQELPVLLAQWIFAACWEIVVNVLSRAQQCKAQLGFNFVIKCQSFITLLYITKE